MIITIDGPAGAGKSTVARKLAKRLGFEFLDTGAMYRAIAFALTQLEIDLEDRSRIVEALQALSIDIRNQRIFVNDHDVTRQIRTNEIAQGASVVATIPEVRTLLVDLQRQIAERGNFVCEGRDQGTVVFPHASCKAFLTAAPEVRAQRRWKEMTAKQPDLLLEDVIAEQKIRDLRDETRSVGRLEQAVDATLVRVDQLTEEAVVDYLEALARAALEEAASK